MSNTSGIRAGRAYVEIGTSDKLSKGLKAAEAKLKAFAGGLQSLGTKLMAVGGIGAGFLAGAVKAFADGGDQLLEMSQRTGVSVEALSELRYIAVQTGVDMEGLEGSLRKMQKNLGAAAMGGGTAGDAFAKLGLDVQQLMRMNPDEQFTAIADRLTAIRDPTLKAAVAMEIFGRAGTGILPMIEGGRAGMEKMRTEARKLGLVTSTEAAEGASQLQDKLDVLTLVGKKLYSAFGSALVPMFTEMADRAIQSGAAAIKWVKDHKELIIVAFKVAAGLFAAGAAAYAAGRMINAGLGAIGTIGSVLKFGMSLFGTLGSLLMGLLSPVGLVVGALAVLGGYLLYTSGYGGKALEWLGGKFQELLGFVNDVIGGISDALAAGDIGLAAKVLWAGLKLAWETGVGSLNKIWLQGKRWFLTQFFEMWSGVLSTVEFAWHGIKVGWIETTAFLSKAWNTCTTGIAKGWQWTSSYLAVQWATVQNLLTKGWNELKGLWDDGFDVAGANEAADKALVDAEQGINKQRDDNLKRINSEHDAQMKALETERKAKETAETKRHEDRLRGINEQEDKNVADLNKNTDEKVAAAQAGLDEATKNYQAARGQAKRAREQVPNADIGSVKKPRDAFGDIEDLMAKKISQAGTFNPMAVRGLGPDATALRIARATEQTAENTKRLRANAGLSFE